MEAKQLHLFNEENFLMQEIFLNVLHHDAKKHGGMYCQVNITPDGFLKQKWSSKGSTALMVCDQTVNSYIALNTFHKAGELADCGFGSEEKVTLKRDSSHLHAITCIYLDLDYHKGSAGELESRINHTSKVLEASYEEGLLPKPTMITETGRGLGIFYVLSRSVANTEKTQKQIRFWKYLCSEFTKKYNKILSSASEPCLEIDGSVTGDTARIVRLPGTRNLKAGRTCRVQVNDDLFGVPLYYSLQELASYIEGYGVYDAGAFREKRRQLKRNKTVNFTEFKNPVLFERLKELERCQKLWKHKKESRRELLCFIYFNTARCLVGKTEAYRMMKEFNEGFDYPISLKELEPIIKQKTIYKFKDETLLDKLDLTEEENAYVGFGISLKEIKRQQIKEENQKNRRERNEAVISHVVQHPDDTYEEVAALFGVSLRTVKNILKDADVHRYQKQVTETSSCDAENNEPDNMNKEEKTAPKIIGFSSKKEAENIRQSKVQKNAPISIYMLSALKNIPPDKDNIVTYRDKKNEAGPHTLMDNPDDGWSPWESWDESCPFKGS